MVKRTTRGLRVIGASSVDVRGGPLRQVAGSIPSAEYRDRPPPSVGLAAVPTLPVRAHTLQSSAGAAGAYHIRCPRSGVGRYVTSLGLRLPTTTDRDGRFG